MITLDAIADFLAKSRPDVIGQWPRDHLLGWIDFQARQGSIAVAGQHGAVNAVGIATRCQLPDMDDPWTQWDSKGDCLYVHQVMADSELGMQALLALMIARVPDWHSLRMFGFRHGRRVRITPEFLKRVWQRNQKAVLKDL